MVLLLILALGGSTGSFFLGRVSLAWGTTPLPVTSFELEQEPIDQQLAQSLRLRVYSPFTGYFAKNGEIMSTGSHLLIDQYVYLPYVLFPESAEGDGYIMSRWFVYDGSLVFSETPSSFMSTPYTAYAPTRSSSYLIALYYCQQFDCSDAHLIHVESIFVNDV